MWMSNSDILWTGSSWVRKAEIDAYSRYKDEMESYLIWGRAGRLYIPIENITKWKMNEDEVTIHYKKGSTRTVSHRQLTEALKHGYTTANRV